MLWGFFKTHVLQATSLVVFGSLSVYGMISDAYGLWTAGLPPEVWSAISALAFFATVIVVLASFQATMQTPQTVNGRITGPTPEPGPTNPLRKGLMWRFAQPDGYALSLEWVLERRGEPPKFRVSVLQFSAVNDGPPIHHIKARLTLLRSKVEIPLFVTTSDGQWAGLDDLRLVPTHSHLHIGTTFEAAASAFSGFKPTMSPEEFLSDVGGFELTISVDDDPPETWKFTASDLRKQIDRYKVEAIEQIASNPLLQPTPEIFRSTN